MDSRLLLAAASTDAVHGPGENTPYALFSCSSEMNSCRPGRRFRALMQILCFWY